MRNLLFSIIAATLVFGMVNLTSFAAEGDSWNFKTEKNKVEDKAGLVEGESLNLADRLLEEMRLILSSDDQTDAELRVDFTEERIAEAKLLVNEGKTESAKERLKGAILQQKQAISELDLNNVLSDENIQSAYSDIDIENQVKTNLIEISNVVDKMSAASDLEQIKQVMENTFTLLETKIENSELSYPEQLELQSEINRLRAHLLNAVLKHEEGAVVNAAPAMTAQ